jgi:ABC-type transport system involved in cytochrome bd biosynthesis fused ATPase/permease subunit
MGDSSSSQQVIDSIANAVQLGRLDFVSALLAMIALLLAVSAFPIFFYLRQRAATVAREAVKEELAGALERIEASADARIQEMLPGMVEAYFELMKNSISAEDANEMAAAQESEPENQNNG